MDKKQKIKLVRIVTEYLMLVVSGWAGGMAVVFMTLTGKDIFLRTFGAMVSVTIGFFIWLVIRGHNKFPQEFLDK